MARTWVDGEGVPVSDLVRLGTASSDTYLAAQAHMDLRRGLAHPLVKRHSVYTLDGGGRVASAVETYNDTKVSNLQVSGNTISSTVRTITLEYNAQGFINYMKLKNGR